MKRDINTLSLLNEISELVYVSDPETYELLFVNQTGCQTLHLENYKHKKCYEILQGKTSPCEFCTNDRLCDDNFYTWEFTNPSIGRHFLLKDKIIQWRGKTARMEIAFDITERELQKQELKNMLDVQTLITNCVRMLYAVDARDTVELVDNAAVRFKRHENVIGFVFELNRIRKLFRSPFVRGHNRAVHRFYDSFVLFDFGRLHFVSGVVVEQIEHFVLCHSFVSPPGLIRHTFSVCKADNSLSQSCITIIPDFCLLVN